MEFHVHLTHGQPVLADLETTLLGVDPSAVVDVDATGDTLRLAGAFTAAEVVTLMHRAGYPVDPAQVEQLPSICCGGCSG